MATIRKFCKKCDICGRNPSETGTTFVDGATFSGRWADMCENCYSRNGVGIGIGLGQRYSLESGDQIEGGSQSNNLED